MKEKLMENIKAYPRISNAILLLLLLVLLEIVFGLGMGIFEFITKTKMGPLLMGIVNIISIGLVIFVGMRRARISAARMFKLPQASILLYLSTVIVSIGLGIAMSEVDNLVRSFFPPPEFIDNIFLNLFIGENNLSGLFLLIIVAPFTEETLFRGLFLRGFLKNYSSLTAILVSSLFFALVHFNPWQFASASVTGIFFAILYMKTKSIIPCILGHAVFNGFPYFVINVLKLQIRGYSEIPMVNGHFQPLWFNLSALAIIAAGSAIFYLAIRNQSTAEESDESSLVS